MKKQILCCRCNFAGSKLQRLPVAQEGREYYNRTYVHETRVIYFGF